MAIKGLTDQRAQFPCIGKLRKGAAKQGNKPGADLDHFRLDSKDSKVAETFRNVYGDRPQLIRCMLPYDTVEECFFTCMEDWAAGGLKVRCDGETILAQQVNGNIQRHFAQPLPCMETCNCKPVGRLNLVVQGLNRFAYISCETHSKNDIVNIHSQLTAVAQEFGSLRRVPFILTRRPEMISTPSGKNGGRARREKWMLSIEIDPQWAQTQFALMQHQHQTGRLAGIVNTEVIEAQVELSLPAAKVDPTAFRHEELWIQWRSQLHQLTDHDSIQKMEDIARQYAQDGMLQPFQSVQVAIDDEIEIARGRVEATGEAIALRPSGQDTSQLIKQFFAVAYSIPAASWGRTDPIPQGEAGKNIIKGVLGIESVASLSPDQLNHYISHMRQYEGQAPQAS